MSAISAVYSFKDVSGSITNPVLPGPIIFAGQIGVGSFSIVMHTERTVLDTASDGTVMPSYIPGDSGEFSVEVQQTSLIDQALLDLYNILKASADNGDVSNWAATAVSLRNIVTGRQHLLQGVAFGKIPDRPYQSQGAKLTWRLLAANVVNM